MDEAHRLSRVGLQIETWSRQPAFFGITSSTNGKKRAINMEFYSQLFFKSEDVL